MQQSDPPWVPSEEDEERAWPGLIPMLKTVEGVIAPSITFIFVRYPVGRDTSNGVFQREMGGNPKTIP